MDMENDIKNLKELLKQGVSEFGAELSDGQIESLLKYKDLLQEWNRKINLTAIEEDKEIIIKHYIDSLSIFKFIENKKLSLIDVGTAYL